MLPQSPRSLPLILIPCSGCHLNDHSLILQDARIKCSISIRTNQLPSLHDQNHVLQQLSSVIASALLCDDKIKLTLIDIASKFFSYTNFQFYSDGSVSDIGTINSKSGFGWSESFAILTILLVLPPNATCEIFTDSQNCIDAFNQRLGSPIISP
ncbi:hypothetical protein GLOIN_2v1843361 [Rhizophagus irregularis DAOM 181602=DAOM 197198]|nr:hypothetical protein GLOIN_2v1843361 [Rhizophagus irregularis DAOM 181602=DAOM 197198]